MESMSLTQLLLSTLFLLCPSGAEEETEALSCPEHQQGFDRSCYEFVGLRRSFFSAQGWCERGGGHLAFIQNEETQQFLQKHLESETDWWLGLAPASAKLTLDSSAAEGKRTHNGVFVDETYFSCYQMTRMRGTLFFVGLSTFLRAPVVAGWLRCQLL